jgi:DtxR family Mn-dependent transcriptional regulator
MDDEIRASLSESQEDYLKQILLLGDRTGLPVGTRDLAVRLGVRPASVTGMVQRLAALGLVEHERYRGVQLTARGRRVALEMVRHHRLLETFLLETLGYTWDEVHDEAERLEHAISERFEERIAEALGHPTHDPHGDPIPRPDLSMPESPAGDRLAELPPGCRGRVVRVETQDPDALTLLARLELVPGAALGALESVGNGIRVELADGTRYLIPMELARRLWVEPENAEEKERAC